MAQLVKNLLVNAGDTGFFDPWVGKIPWRRVWQPTPVFFPGKFHGQRGLVGYSPWGCKESDTTEQLTFSLSLSIIYRMDKPQGPTVEHRELYSITYDKP